MRIGIVSAFGKESKPLRSRLQELRREAIDGSVFFLHRYEKDEVVVARTGQGQHRGAHGTQLLIERFDARVIINCGVAGAVSPQRQVGDVVISEKVVEYCEEEGDWIMKDNYSADPDLLQTALQISRNLLPIVRTTAGIILSGTDVINSLDKRETLWARFRGQCVEQEGAGMAKVCNAHKIPWIVIRGISDHADEHVQHDFKKNVEHATHLSTLVTFEMIKILVNRSSLSRQRIDS